MTLFTTFHDLSARFDHEKVCGKDRAKCGGPNTAGKCVDGMCVAGETWYREQFPPSIGPGMVAGESSVGYLTSATVPGAIMREVWSPSLPSPPPSSPQPHANAVAITPTAAATTTAIITAAAANQSTTAVHQVGDKAKFICLLREPVARIQVTVEVWVLLV